MGGEERSQRRFYFGPREMKGRRCTMMRTEGGGIGVLTRKMTAGGGGGARRRRWCGASGCMAHWAGKKDHAGVEKI
jgi:hypothetical protein